MAKIRLDQLLVNQGLVQSREKGRALIMAGSVYVNDKMIDKPGTPVQEKDHVKIRGKSLPYVSRGGLKLEKALQSFNLELQDKVIIDIGASTGGFTDCALQKGAVKSYAVDVGYGQLAWTLRQDPRVINLERKNARYLSPEDIPEQTDVITIDVAFISLEKILPAVSSFLKDGGQIIALIKPQFEAGREKVGKKGVVKDPAVHQEVIKRIVDFCLETGLLVKGLDYSPITGPEGNIEFLLLLEKNDSLESANWEDTIDDLVNSAHQVLKS